MSATYIYIHFNVFYTPKMDLFTFGETIDRNVCRLNATKFTVSHESIQLHLMLRSIVYNVPLKTRLVAIGLHIHENEHSRSLRRWWNFWSIHNEEVKWNGRLKTYLCYGVYRSVWIFVFNFFLVSISFLFILFTDYFLRI